MVPYLTILIRQSRYSNIKDIPQRSISNDTASKAPPKKPDSPAARKQSSGADLPAVRTSTLDINAIPTHKPTGKPLTQVNIDEDLAEHDKPWRRPGTDLSDYFNYGLDEFTWALYASKQGAMRQEFNSDTIAANNKKMMEDMQNMMMMGMGGMPGMMPGAAGGGQGASGQGGPPGGMPGMEGMPPEMQQMMQQMMASGGMDPSQMDPSAMGAMFAGMQNAGGQQGQGGQPQNFGGGNFGGNQGQGFGYDQGGMGGGGNRGGFNRGRGGRQRY